MNGINLHKYSNSNSISKKVKKSIVGVGKMVDLPEKYMLKIEDQEPEQVIKIDVKELSITTQKGDYQFAYLDNLLQSLVLKNREWNRFQRSRHVNYKVLTFNYSK